MRAGNVEDGVIKIQQDLEGREQERAGAAGGVDDLEGGEDAPRGSPRRLGCRCRR